jgi:hypothetical protein
MTAFVLGLPETKVRVIAPDVGGGFGSKIYLYAEDVALVWASKQVNRSIKWTADRSEAFVSDAHGRDHVTHAETCVRQGRQVPRDAGEHHGQPGGHTCRRSRRAFRRSFMQRCSPASTRRPRSFARSPRRSRIPCRSMRTAAQDGRKRPTWSSASCTRPRWT